VFAVDARIMERRPRFAGTERNRSIAIMKLANMRLILIAPLLILAYLPFAQMASDARIRGMALLLVRDVSQMILAAVSRAVPTKSAKLPSQLQWTVTAQELLP
jgi:hypothetical protein